ncbi:Polygalacturonase [Pseudooceanicola antarcticus]|uniref:Polygalacturonase n=1 Tax=Pseudooceanicola antarcticus TaxID=1247613 RepID=A0A285JC25_9RHOB|nr:glycoside hydrolase family 88 protein [Pseudooceanicola antarcticus]PJE30915.1 hypothetical protein CVM39_05585 [Pseudooceanicola antarcticus]SNY57819.1 Polygalacturonase [Pseudooceanicola antarcticus]
MSALSLASVSSRTACLLVAPPGTRYGLAAPMGWSCAGEGRIVARGETRVAPVFIEGLSPDTDYEFSIGRQALSFRTAPCAGLVKVTDHGASPDLADNAPAFARALAALPEGGTLHVPAGRFAISPVFLRAQMTLWLEEGAELFALHDRSAWPILPPRDDAGRVIGTWEGLPEASFAAPLTAVDCDGLVITGLGTLDAGGDRGDWWSWPKDTRDDARRPRALFLAHGRDVQLSGITVRNSPSWTVHPYRIDGLTCAGLKIQNPHDSPNTDGLNPESCTDVTLAGIHFSVGDDCIAVKSGKRGTGALKGLADHLAPTRRLHVHHCLMERGHGGMVLGSEMSGDITDVTVTACEFIGTDRGLRIKTRRGRGGEVARVHFSDVLMQGVGTPLAINAFYYCDPDGRSPEVQSRNPAPVDETTPRIHDITFRNVIATDVAVCAVAVLGLPEAPVTGVRLMNFRASLDPSAPPQVPLMADGVEAVSGRALWSDFAEVAGQVIPIEEQETPQVLTRYFTDFLAAWQPYKEGRWCYEDGCIFRGLALLADATGEAHWRDTMKRMVDAQIGEGPSLAGYNPSEYNIDNILSGRALLDLAEQTGDPVYMQCAALEIRQLDTHPRTRSGVYWHKLRYPWQVWLDGLYMGPPFQIGYGLATGQEAYVTDSLTQLDTALKMLFVEKTGLYAHAIDEAKMQPWCDPETGMSHAHWSRSLGWLVMALVDVAELVGPERFAPLRDRTVKLLADVASYRRPEGLWLQVLDEPELEGNYLETSASAMFVYGLLKGAELGLYDGDVAMLFDDLTAYALREVEGKPSMVEMCWVAGLGWFEGRFRDGTGPYYVSERRVSDDAKGVGPLMMAAAAEIARKARG